MDFTLRPAVVDDAEAMTRMHIQSWRESYGHLLPPEFFAKQEATLPDRIYRRNGFVPDGKRQLCDPSWYSLPEHRMVRPAVGL
jgi:hypothetical protein